MGLHLAGREDAEQQDEHGSILISLQGEIHVRTTPASLDAT
jgi:hypothetical protein